MGHALAAAGSRSHGNPQWFESAPVTAAALPPPQDLIAQTQQQLARLDTLPPDLIIGYGWQLVEQAQVLWPEQAKSLARQPRTDRVAKQIWGYQKRAHNFTPPLAPPNVY
ncbi:VasL domain-containing protein [Candidatus Pantoea floridensis]|uniref:VasL domain-containing protein n=1 Tax=Candidatus Pantoea floridensis TaxID=1938870 RepID=UPI001144D409